MLRIADVRRMTLIGDSVFAVSITLLAHTIELPGRMQTTALDDPVMVRLIRDVGGVVLSVVVASLFWLGHWRYMRNVRTASVPLIVSHFLFLLGLILLPIATSFYISNAFGQVATFVYACNLLYLSLVALSFRYFAIRCTPHADRSPMNHLSQAIMVLLTLASVLVSFDSATAARKLWYLGALTPLVEIGVARRLARRAPAASVNPR